MESIEEKYRNAINELELQKKRFDMLAKTRAIDIARFIEALTQNYGEEGNEIGIRVFGEGVRENAEKAFRKFEKKAKGAMDMLTTFHTAGGIKGEVIESTPTRAVRHETYCPFQGVWSGEICDKADALSFPAICASLNPKIVFSRPKCLNKGDDYCEIIFEIKE